MDTFDVVASVPAVAALAASRSISAGKSAVYLKLVARQQASSGVSASTTEPVPIVGDANRWFAVALRLPRDAIEATFHVCITPLESYTPLVEVAISKVDVAELVGSGRLKHLISGSDAGAAEIKMVICSRDGSSPLEGNLILNKIEAGYAFPARGVIFRELIGEVRFGYSVAEDFIGLRVNNYKAQVEQYQHVLKVSRASQGIFSSDEEALRNGYYPCAIRIVGIQKLEQVQRLPGSKSLSSPFVSVTVNSPRFPAPKQVGRTNTEYRTADPVFGTNANVALAEHASPRTEFDSGRYGRVCPDGIWMETYLKRDESLTLTVFHERHSVYQGLTNTLMCSVELSFEFLADGSPTVRELDLKGLDGSSKPAGKLFVVAFLRRSTGDESPFASTNPFDLVPGTSEHVVSTNPFDGIAISETGEIIPLVENKSYVFPNLLRIPTFWLAGVIQTMNGHLGALTMMADEIRKRRQHDSDVKCFKSSSDKKKLSVAAITTNLHQVEFSVASTQSPFETKSRYAYTTCGVPAAIALGVDNLSNSLLVMKQRLAELDRDISSGGGGTLQRGPFDLVSSAFDDRPTATIIQGAEPAMVVCPLGSACTKPKLCVDETCGSPNHRSRSTASTAAAKTTSNALRSAAASVATRFTTISASASAPAAANGPDAPAPEDSKPVPLAKWQSAVELQQEIYLRETVAVSQSLAPIASAFMAEALLALQRGSADARSWGEQLVKAGFLIGWESLISTHGKEMSMLSDVIGVVQFLNSRCRIVCRGASNQADAYSVEIQEGGSVNGSGAIALVITFPTSAFSKLFPPLDGDQYIDAENHSNGDVTLSLYVVLFSQGVNETQSISNLLNKDWAAKQAEVNRASIQKLVKYAMLLHKTLPLPVLRLNAIVENQREDEKETDVLLLADDAIRSLRGARQVMCKSGKDRTAMAVTLEQSRIGAASLNSAASVRDLANLMREFGVRIRIAEKNVGAPRYSFNVIQRMALPVDYRPPVSVIQDMATSYSKKDS